VVNTGKRSENNEIRMRFGGTSEVRCPDGRHSNPDMSCRGEYAVISIHPMSVSRCDALAAT
jgi:hypothetical protein